ncbi:MAG: hypothetical protein ACRC57_10510 [Sarcina sp.]
MDELAIQLGDGTFVVEVLPNRNLQLTINRTYPAPEGTTRVKATNSLTIEMRIDTNRRPSDGNVSKEDTFKHLPLNFFLLDKYNFLYEYKLLIEEELI